MVQQQQQQFTHDLQKRVVTLVEAARSIGINVYHVSHQWDQLGLASSTIDTVLHTLEAREDNWLEVTEGMYDDVALESYKWGFASIASKYSNLLCIRSPLPSTSSTIQHFCTSILQTMDDYYLIETQSLAQSLAVEIGRQAQNETLLDIKAPGKSKRNLDTMGSVDLDVNIFANATDYLCQVLKADGCAIFDLSLFRMTNFSTKQTQSDSSSAAANDSALGSGMTQPKSSTSSGGSDGQMTSVQDTHDTCSPLTSLASLPSHSGSQSNFEKEQHVISRHGASHCSYQSSPYPIRILGHSGSSSINHFEDLSGMISKPIIARYLSMTRTSSLNSKAYVESDTSANPMLTGLAPSDARTVLCCSVSEADSQPTYLIFAYFTIGQVEISRIAALFLEQVGTCLVYSTIRSRVIAVDRAQLRFTQRIQHELRTPLHAIMGVSEIAKHSFGDNFNMSEMKDLINSIGYSADSLNLLVDDVVDFSLMERVGGERKLMQVKQVAIEWESICQVITSTSLQVFALIQRLNKVRKL